MGNLPLSFCLNPSSIIRLFWPKMLSWSIGDRKHTSWYSWSAEFSRQVHFLHSLSWAPNREGIRNHHSRDSGLVSQCAYSHCTSMSTRGSEKWESYLGNWKSATEIQFNHIGLGVNWKTNPFNFALTWILNSGPGNQQTRSKSVAMVWISTLDRG